MPRIPVATYRLQLHADFGFDDAAAIADYLHELGISHVYCSPYLQAAPGSTHGYDVVDHHKVNEELGGAEAHDRFSKRLGECQLGQVLDIVPNHMAISGRRNRLWWDIWENGPSSRYAPYFDIDWQPRDLKLRNKLLVPILDDHYGRVLKRGDVQVKRRGADFFVQYQSNELPLSPRSLAPLLSRAANETGSDHLSFLAGSIANLPGPTLTDRASKAARHRGKTVIMNLLERLFTETPFLAEAVDATLREVNENIDQLDNVLEQQNYRLAFWQTAQQELPYRRFFDVNTLVALRMENPQAFADTHALILRWLREGVLDGIRIDHPDGLQDPKDYFERLRAEARDVWIVAEKILERGEKLRSEWPIDGTTGYDFLNQAGALLVDRDNEEAFTRIYAEFTGEPTDYKAVCRDQKHRALRDLLGSDVNRLTNLLADICEAHRDQRDYTRKDIMRAIRELVACFPVYRTYVVPERDELTDDDRFYIDEAIDCSKSNRPEIDPCLFDFIRNILFLKARGSDEAEFVMRLQQFCGPAMAKGVEDTVFYQYNRLISLNEVGGSPDWFGVTPEEFHRYCCRTRHTHPRTMLSSSTHDAKRSEDVRARISLLAEKPDLWRKTVTSWATLNERHKSRGWPDKNTEYFLYQTMIGAWPISLDRLLPYMEKACREAKQMTSWLAPHEEFEAATRKFIEAIYASPRFMKNFEDFVAPLIRPGWINSLTQTLLKLMAPGIPDTYQGEELWQLNLVDPDNRRPVDYDHRRRLLKELPGLSVDQVWQRIDEGLPKLWVTFHALRLRRERSNAFGPEGTYEALHAHGPQARHFIGFSRGSEVLVMAPRLNWQLSGNWQATRTQIPSGNWYNVLTGETWAGETLMLADLLGRFPVGLLVKI
jgi:(1->4)-alpha-D-glucan 1-alpha-D-glucosylmutase